MTAESSSTMIIALFDSLEKAREARRGLQQADRQLDTIKLGNIAVVAKNAAGKITFDETADVNIKRGAIFGTIAGVLLGGFLGAGVGAAIGAGVGKFVDLGFPNAELERIGGELAAGRGAVVTLVKRDEYDVVVGELTRLGGTLSSRDLSDVTLAQVAATVPATTSTVLPPVDITGTPPVDTSTTPTPTTDTSGSGSPS